MIMMLLVVNVIGIIPNIKFHKEQEFSLYPTVGEFYDYYLEFFRDEQFQLMCEMHPKVLDVQVINQCEEIYRKKGNQFLSISSNNTHFGTLSINNEVVIYEWKNSMIQQVGDQVPIESSFNCFNINLSLDVSILVDCYNNNEFFLIQSIDTQLIIAYQIESSVPTSTKIQSIVNGTNAFIVYAQYFENYSILSLFSSSFFNLSSLNNQFIDFDIIVTISPKIYAITSKEIFQLSISSDFQFYFKCNFSQDNMSDFTTITVIYNFQSYSQCDQIQIIYSEYYIASLQGCENKIIMIKSGGGYFSTQNILQNNQFIIYQCIDTIIIQDQQADTTYFYYLTDQSNSLIYLNSDTVKKDIFFRNQSNKLKDFRSKANHSLLNMINISINNSQFYWHQIKFHLDKYNSQAINIYNQQKYNLYNQ